MLIRIHFRYIEEIWTTYNKTLNIAMISIILLAFVGALVESITISELPEYIVIGLVFIVLGLVYLLFALKAFKVCLRRKKRMKGTRISQGYIKNKIVTSGWRISRSDSDGHYEYINLQIQYINPFTGEERLLETPRVNGDPFTYLSSLDVTVYVKPDGSAWATDFKWIKSLKDSWGLNNPELADRIKPIRREE